MSKFSVQLTSSEVADPCVGLKLTITKLPPGVDGLTAGSYAVRGSITIVPEPPRSNRHDFPPSGAPQYNLILGPKTPEVVWMSIPFNDGQYVNYEDGDPANLSTLLEAPNGETHPLGSSSTTTNKEFRDPKFMKCLE